MTLRTQWQVTHTRTEAEATLSTNRVAAPLPLLPLLPNRPRAVKLVAVVASLLTPAVVHRLMALLQARFTDQRIDR
jgi:hypothetical protein